MSNNNRASGQLVPRFFKTSSRSSGTEDDDAAQAAYLRRREQVRRAQRKHRDRRANYVKALEIEVNRLRAEARMRDEECAMLRQTLFNHGIQPPVFGAPVDAANQPQHSHASIAPAPQTQQQSQQQQQPLQSLSSDSGLYDQALVTQEATVWKERSLNNGLRFTAGEMNGLPAPTYTPGLPQGQPGVPYTSEAGVGDGLANVSPNHLDLLFGTPWILALEHVCMQHDDLNLTRDPLGTHSHMVSSQLLRHVDPYELRSITTWQVPGADIGRLLALSRSFELVGEITPVQAWYKLKLDPRFGTVDTKRLDKIRQILWKDVKCFGFGAVVDEEIWSIAMDEVLGPWK